MKNKPLLDRFRNAFAGFAAVVLSERSFRTELACAAAAIAAVVILRPGLVWAALVVMCIGFVLAMELLNSAVEYLCDKIHPDWAREIGMVKDAASAAVLIASATSVVVSALMILSLIVR
jgi:diacylglycerol kinase